MTENRINGSFDAANDWACRACGSRHPETDLICTTCGTAREGHEEDADLVLLDADSDDEEEWEAWMSDKTLIGYGVVEVHRVAGDVPLYTWRIILHKTTKPATDSVEDTCNDPLSPDKPVFVTSLSGDVWTDADAAAVQGLIALQRLHLLRDRDGLVWNT